MHMAFESSYVNFVRGCIFWNKGFLSLYAFCLRKEMIFRQAHLSKGGLIRVVSEQSQ